VLRLRLGRRIDVGTRTLIVGSEGFRASAIEFDTSKGCGVDEVRYAQHQDLPSCRRKCSERGA
jgi:hypothetical protein